MPALLETAVAGGVRAAIILSSGFAEAGPASDRITTGSDDADTVLASLVLYGVIALITSAAIAFAVGLTACWWPSRRAAAADPMDAMRAE